MLGAALGLGSLLLQNNANHSAAAAAEADRKRRQALEDRQAKLFDLQMGVVSDLERQGAFNPDTAIANATKKSAYETGMATENAAGAARTLGYRPGDTAPVQNINKINNDAAQHLLDLKLNLTRTAALDKIAAYQSPNAGLLASGVNSAQNDMNYDRSQQQSLAPIIGSITPFLQTRQKKVTPAFNLGTADTWGDLNSGSQYA